jgi:uncharacterized protein YqfB (UPF0267 family)
MSCFGVLSVFPDNFRAIGFYNCYDIGLYMRVTTIAVSEDVKRLLDELRDRFGARSYNELLRRMIDRLLFTEVSLQELRQKRAKDMTLDELKQAIRHILDEESLLYEALRVIKRSGAYSGKELSAELERLPPETPTAEVELIASIWHARKRATDKLKELMREYVRRA